MLAQAETLTRQASSDSAREQLAARYDRVRSWSEQLCQPLATEDYVIQSMPDASPIKWHLAHTSWFFETFVIQPTQPGYVADPDYSYLFNSYYNSVGPMHCRPRRGMISRPTVAETWDYRRRIDEMMSAVFAEASSEQWNDLERLIELGIQHEQQHQELVLTDLKHLLAQNPLRPAYQKAPLSASPTSTVQELNWISFPEGLYWIGHPKIGFAFDNEQPQHRVWLEGFQLADRLVTNGEYLKFIEDGGYQQPEWWLSLGWMTVQENNWRAPLYWEKRDGDWWMFTLSGMRPVAVNEPVCHISFFEADAFARWSGARLPEETEWELAAADIAMEGNFAEGGHGHPRPRHESTDRLAQMFGDVWEWTRSAYGPYPGYSPLPGAVGEYNGKFMCNQYVLRGGSCATPAAHIRRTYRNFFPPDKRWQFSGVRLARKIK